MRGCKVLIVGGGGRWGQRYLATLDKFFPDVHYDIAGRDDWYDKLNDHYDGVIVTTPPQKHVEIAAEAIRMHRPVMIEKPLALSADDCRALQMLSEAINIPIIINHIHLFSHPHRRLKDSINKPIESIRTYGCGSGPIRDYSSLYDYGAHDISIILDIVKKMPLSVFASKATKSILTDNIGELFNIEMDFGAFKSLSTVGNGAPGKMRMTTIKTAAAWLSSQAEPLDPPPLMCSIGSFISAVKAHRAGKEYISPAGLTSALMVQSILDAAQQSINSNKKTWINIPLLESAGS
jgi:predicted dehydrogenase